MLAVLANTHLWCAAAGALAMKLMSTTAMWAGWGEAAKVGQAAAAAASIVKTVLTPTTPLPTTVAEMKAAAMTATTPVSLAPAPTTAVKQGIISKIERLFHATTAAPNTVALPAPLVAEVEKMLTGLESRIVAVLEAEIAAHTPPAPAAPVPPVVQPTAVTNTPTVGAPAVEAKV